MNSIADILATELAECQTIFGWYGRKPMELALLVKIWEGLLESCRGWPDLPEALKAQFQEHKRHERAFPLPADIIPEIERQRAMSLSRRALCQAQPPHHPELGGIYFQAYRGDSIARATVELMAKKLKDE